MSKKIIYVSFIRLTDKVTRDWYIDYSINKGAVVEYWDIVSLVREEHEEKGQLDLYYLRYIKTYKEFRTLVRKKENRYAVYVMMISYSGRFSKPYRILSKYSCRMVYLSWAAMPSTIFVPRLKRIIYGLFSNPVGFVKTAIDVRLGIAYRKLNIVRPFDILFVAGSVLSNFDQHAKRVVQFNQPDFDHYSRVKLTNKRIVQGKYAVFLDINLPFQSDLAICGLTQVNALSYIKSLNRFFDLIEKFYDIKIVIAAHPKANYDSKTFEDRETYRLQTAELVKDAEFVLTHQSTSLSYAVLNLKSVLFIYNDEMIKHYENSVIPEIEGHASYFNACVYNVDQITDGSQVKIHLPNRERYDAYKYSYLTSYESEKFSSAEIFWSNINTDFA